MDATLGRETDALSVPRRRWPRRRTATTSTRRCAGWSACTTDKPRWGDGAASGRRAGAPRAGSRPVVRAGAARVVRAGRTARPPRLQVRLFGLLGPNGPLPLHLTEYARERLRHAGDPTLSRFLDLFHHRFLALFYRAWAQAQPTVNHDRPERRPLRRLRRRVRRASACRRCATATPCRTSRSCFYAGALVAAGRATPKGWRAILGDFFRMPVRDRGVRRPLAGAAAASDRRRLGSAGARRRSASAPCSAAASGTASTSSASISAR